jgi:hypothetical protein
VKCPRCGADSEVLATRQDERAFTVRRRRQCFNEHRFYTLEVLPPATSQKTLADAARGAIERINRWRRDRLVLRDPRPSAHVARDLGLTGARVRQIRKGAARART